MNQPFTIPDNPLSPEQIQALRATRANFDKIAKHIADAKAAGIDVTKEEQDFKVQKAQIEKLLSVYDR